MKKILFSLFLVGLFAFSAFGADVRITALPANTTPTSDDLIPIVNDPGGSPATNKSTLQDAYKIWQIGTFAAPTTTNPYSLAAYSNVILWYGATGEIDLPAAVAGMNVCIYNTGAFTITIDPNGTDVIVRDGTAQSAGVSFTLSSGAGNYVCIVADTANHWVTLGYKGTLAQGS